MPLAGTGTAVSYASQHDSLERARMALSAGARLGPYEILEPLGAGGMGELYRAKDTRLDRPGALNFLLEKLFGNQLALERCRREARAAAALNHPRSAVIYGLEEDDRNPFLVLKLVEFLTRRDAGRGNACSTTWEVS